MKLAFVLTLLLSSLTHLYAAAPPTAKIANGSLQAQIYLPDLHQGFYRGTRFDWSGVISSLQLQGHDYYGPWFNKTSPTVHDFIYDGADIIAGPCSATTGPADEFGPIGWDSAKPGGTFIKIGVGALRKPDDAAYDNYRLYEIADPGKWAISRKTNSVEFVQTINDAASGFGYVYRKTVRLSAGKPEMVLSHNLKNTGTHAIETSVYNHNFLVLDRRAPGPGVSISVPFQIRSARPPEKKLAEIRGNQIVYLETLTGHDTVATPLEGFGQNAADHQIRIENREVGAGMTIQSDRPLAKESLWSIRTVIAMEPFVAISIEPGSEFSWKTTYEYFLLP
jgi:hypothetical protein